MNGINEIKGILTAVLKGMIVYLVSVVIISAVFYFFTVNENYIPMCRSGIAFLCAFLTGVWSVKGKNTKGYLRGLFSGIISAVILMGISSLLGGRPISNAAVTYFIMVVISVCGGIIGINVN